MLDSKKLITDEINSIFIEYQTRIEENTSKEKEWMKEKEIVNQVNHRLIQEVAEKDKLLFHNERKFLDYEIIINKVQDEALKEMDEKTKHDMLRAQDREIFERDEEIKRLQKKIQCLEEEKTLVVSTVKEVVQEVKEFKEENTKTLVEKMKDATEEEVKEDMLLLLTVHASFLPIMSGGLRKPASYMKHKKPASHNITEQNITEHNITYYKLTCIT